MNLQHSQPTFQIPNNDNPNQNAAVDLIRGKLDTIYQNEPNAVQEAEESVSEPASQRSKHQRKMYELATSGKPLAQIQTEWHAYYLSLNNQEKHEVWQEFYSANQHHGSLPAAQPVASPVSPQSAAAQPVAPIGPQPAAIQPAAPQPFQPVISGGFDPNLASGSNIFIGPRPAPANVASRGTKNVAELKQQLTSRVSNRAKLNRKQHLQSLGFGLVVGSVMVLILLFGFFNERFIAPFITPSRNVSATPLIVSDGGPVGAAPEVIIPKINVELPVIYGLGSIDEVVVDKGLESGVVHYDTTSSPGQSGNIVIFGHSSNNILNKGKYKFAFVLLSRLEAGDTFYLQKDGKRYVYKVFDKKIVKPTEVDVLNAVEGHPAMATLITCDPPGTSINRLVVMADQISPDPAANATSTALQTDKQPIILASNSESLWHRLVHSIF